MRYKIFLAACLSLAFPILSYAQQRADLIVHHAQVYTVDSAFSKAEAFAVRDGKIIAVGTDRQILHDFRSDSMKDAGGRPVFPGFIDAHAHFVNYGQSLFTVDLFGCASFEEVVERVRAFAAAHPDQAWIQGRGWDQNRWADKSFPNNSLLNRYFPNTPVFLARVDGHAAIANASALEAGRVKAGMKIEGGQVETRDGRLTGILVDNAQELIYTAIPPPTPEIFTRWLDAAQQKCFARGLTTITDCGLDLPEIKGIDSLQHKGLLKMRLYVMMSDRAANLDYYIPRGPYKTDRLYVRGVKAYADGALGSRGACLLQPYSDKPGWQGFLLSPVAHFDELAARLVNTDFQLCTHAIGDSANRMILHVYQRHLGGRNDKRWRIEHAQIIDPQDLVLFGQASVIPSVQPTHATSDMYWAGDRLGAARLKGGYVYRQLLEQNGWIALGTDFPVEDISPLKTFLAAVFRVDAKGYPSGGFQRENALGREEAIRGMTIWAAKADFLEKEVGSIEAGKKADFVMLDRDLMTIPWEEVLKTTVLATYSGGIRVY